MVEEGAYKVASVPFVVSCKPSLLAGAYLRRTRGSTGRHPWVCLLRRCGPSLHGGGRHSGWRDVNRRYEASAPSRVTTCYSRTSWLTTNQSWIVPPDRHPGGQGCRFFGFSYWLSRLVGF